MADIEITNGVRKNSHIFRGPDGHSYYFNKAMKGGRISLECVYRKKKNVWCRGRASVDSKGAKFKCTQRHSFPHDQQHYHRQRFRFAVLSRCRKGDFTSFRQIYNEERRKLLGEISRAVCASLPFVTLRPAMARARKASLPCIPHTIPELADMLSSDAHCHLAQTLDSLDNLFAASGGDEENGTAWVIFASERMLRQLASAKKIFSDATFCTPAGLQCRQIWNLVKLRRHHIIPLVRVVMQTKAQTTYELILQKLRELCPTFSPSEVMCDFELGQERAWRTQFPNAHVHGCLFHSCKAIARNVKKQRLTKFIRSNHSANSITRSMCALAFLSSTQIMGGLKKLAYRARREEVRARLQPLFQYFNRYWSTRTEMLSVYNCPDRTNNGCESDNRSLQAAIKFRHPSIFCFLKGLLESEDDAVQDLMVLSSGGNASRKRRSSVLANDAKVRNLISDLQNRDISCSDFLRKVSRTVQTAWNRGLGFQDDFR